MIRIFFRPLVTYIGKDAAETFIGKLQLEADQLFDENIATPKPMLLTATELRACTATTICHVCTKTLGADKVRIHCHFTGGYRGAAHSACNSMYRLTESGWKLPVVIHNLKGYDGHLILKTLKSEFGKVEVIP